MGELVSYILGIGIFLVFAWFTIWLYKRLLAPGRSGKGETTVYVIQFLNGIEVPDLTKSADMMAILDIEVNNQTSYVVESLVNDKKIRELLAQEFGIQSRDVSVFTKNWMQG